MFNSSTLWSSTSPILYMDNTMSYQIDHDLNPNLEEEGHLPYALSYYHSPSPLIYDEIDDHLLSHHDLTLIQQALNKPSLSDVTNDSSTFQVTNKMESNKGSDETINGIVEDDENNNNNTKYSSLEQGLGMLGCMQSYLYRRTNRETVSNSGIVEDDNNSKILRPSSIHGRLRSTTGRSSKKDRHSKIRTANGLRDRRMRLSLEVARPFFKLQDMLGYDKPSRTLEWLLIQAKEAIEELMIQSKHARNPSGVTTTKCTISSTSDGEVESITIKQRNKEMNSMGQGAKDIIKSKKNNRKRATKESRGEARARARKRTLERLIQSRGLKNGTKLPDFDLMEEYSHLNSQSHKDSNHVGFQEDHVDGSLTGSWNFFRAFNYQQNGKICQNFPSYRISKQQNILGGPQ